MGLISSGTSNVVCWCLHRAGLSFYITCHLFVHFSYCRNIKRCLMIIILNYFNKHFNFFAVDETFAVFYRIPYAEYDGVCKLFF